MQFVFLKYWKETKGIEREECWVLLYREEYVIHAHVIRFFRVNLKKYVEVIVCCLCVM